MVFSGIANIAQWYPWRFGFPAGHFWMAWVTMGALVAHLGAKWAITRRSLPFRPRHRPALHEADPVLGDRRRRPARRAQPSRLARCRCCGGRRA